jgi:Integrase
MDCWKFIIHLWSSHNSSYFQHFLRTSILLNITNFVRLRIQPTSLGRELISLINQRNSKAQSRRRSGGPVSYATQLQHAQKITAIICEIQRSPNTVRHLTDVTAVHVEIAVNYILRRNYTAGSCDNWVASLNRLLTWLNKKSLKVSSRETRKQVGLPSRTGYASVDKATADLDRMDQKIKAAQIIAPHVAAVLSICRVLPLRVAEASCLNVKQAIEEISNDKCFRLTAGVKNGRPRWVQTWRDDQLKALEVLAPLCNSIYGSVIPEGVKLDDFLAFFYRTCRGLGLTKSTQSNPHSLRHYLLQDYFKFTTGLDAPIKGAWAPIKQDDPLLVYGYQMVTEIAGHSRRGKSSAYLGSPRAYQRNTKDHYE